jgi:hypothetical protein
MTTTARIEVVGVKDTINQLNKLDKELAKEFKASATSIAQPAINAAKAVYDKVPLSGMNYKWQEKGRSRANFPFTVAKAKAGVRVRFNTRRNAVGVILIEQKDPAAAIFETAGRKNPNKLNTSLMFVGLPVTAGRTRLIGPAVYSARRGIEKELKQVIAQASRTVQKGL